MQNKTKEEEQTEGWELVKQTSRMKNRRHYFRDGRSLCGHLFRSLILNPFQDDKDGREAPLKYCPICWLKRQPEQEMR